MRFMTSPSSIGAFLLLLFASTSLAGDPAGLPKLHHERRITEERTFFGSLRSLLSKRDDCGTQYGPTYVDCGARGCFQPSLGEICCGSVGDYCLVGNFCAGNNCCPNGLSGSCCGTGFNCPANVSDYYTTASSTTPLAGTTTLPVALTTSAVEPTTSAKSSSSLAPITATSVLTSAPASLKSTSTAVIEAGTSETSSSSGTSTSNTATATFVQASGAQDNNMRMGIEGVAVVMLGVVGLLWL